MGMCYKRCPLCKKSRRLDNGVVGKITSAVWQWSEELQLKICYYCWHGASGSRENKK